MGTQQQARAVAAKAVVAVGIVVACGCYDGLPVRTPDRDFSRFVSDAYPILVRDCGFTACHANPARAYKVYAQGRLRLDADSELGDDVTSEELEASYEQARAMLRTGATPTTAPLLRKPLEGAGHAGVDAHGNNVYAHPSEPRYEALVQWATEASP